MANKSLKTRQKMTFRVEAAKPRNPFALRARQRSAGSHVKSTSALRALANRLLKREPIEEE